MAATKINTRDGHRRRPVGLVPGIPGLSAIAGLFGGAPALAATPPNGTVGQLGLSLVVACVLVGVLLVALDRSRRALRRTRLALRSSIAEQNPLIADLPYPVWFKDLGGTYIACNQAFAELFEKSPVDLVGKRDVDLFGSRTTRRWRSADRAAIDAGKAVEHEDWIALPQHGFTALMAFVRKPVYDDRGQVTGILVSAHDITAERRVASEMDRRQSYQRALLDNFPFQVWLKDTEGRYLAVNRPLARQAGTDDTGALARKSDDDVWPPELARIFAGEDRQVMVTRRAQHQERMFDTPDGQRWIETFRAPVLDEQDQLLGTVGFARDISERMQMEQALRESEQRMRSFFRRHSAVLLFIEPGSGRLVDANDAAVAFYGYPREILVGMSVNAINTLNDEQAFEVRRRIVAGEQTHFEFQHRLASGEVRDVEVYSACVNSGGRDLLLSIIHDITERTRIRLLLEQERELFSNGPVVVFRWGTDPGWPVTAVSSNVHSLLGYTREQVLADSFCFAGIVHPDDLAPTEREIEEQLAGSASHFEQSYRLRRADGVYIWVQDFTQIVRDDRGRVCCLQGYILDQSEAKQLAVSLADERRRLEYVIEGTHVGTWEWNVQTGETRFNERWAQILGYRLNELVPISIDTWTRFAHPDDLPRSEAALQAHFDGEAEYYEVEARMRHRDGHWVWVLDRGRVFEWDDEGKPFWMYGTHQDITARKEAEQRLRESEDRLRLAGQTSYDLLYEWHVDKGQLQWFSDVDGLLGYAEGTIRDDIDAWLGLIHPDDRSIMADAARQHAESTDPIDYRYRIRHADGSYRHWHDKARPIVDEQGRPLKWVGICTDITAHHEAHERERLAATVFDEAHDGIVVTDADVRIVDVNRAFTEISGYSREEAIGRNPRFLNSGRQDAAFYEAMWERLQRDGHWSGEIWNRAKDGHVYAENLSITAIRNEHGAVERYVAMFSDITTLKQQQKQLERIAYYDALTDLPNRVMLGDRLLQSMRHADRSGTMLAVAYLDLDGFKSVNDSYGHDIGDRVLVETATRLQSALRACDTLARLGGDEFVAILEDLDDASACAELLPRLLAAAAQPMEIDGQPVTVSASLGVALYPQAEGLDADQLLRQADLAMYQAKVNGKNCYHFFDDSQDLRIRGQIEHIEAVGRAIECDAFRLHFQPKVNMRDGEVIGVEALIRWPQPDGGMRMPADFLPLIEHTPLAAELDNWVLNQALGQLVRWQEQGLDLTVSVNVTAFRLQQPDFVDSLRALLAAHPVVRPGQLIIEVLETTALMDLAHMSEVIRTAQGMGILFALDDFGTGFSSLDYLKNLPARQLKIDRGFVRDMLDDRDDLAILEGIVGLANAFGRELVAEGVESVEHGEILLRLGCEVAQGYGIARPMPAEQLPAWIKAWQPDPGWRDQPRIAREDLPLMFAMVEHRAWIKALKSQLNGRHYSVPEMSGNLCNFGQWLHTQGRNRHAGRHRFDEVIDLHRSIHGMAPQVLELRQQGRLGEAKLRMEEICGKRDALIDALKAMLRPDA